MLIPQRYRVGAAIVACAAFVLLVAVKSSLIPSEICVENPPESANSGCTTYNVVYASFIYVARFLNSEYGVLTAIATGFIGYFTYTLYRATAQQERMARTHERAYVFGGGPVYSQGSGADVFMSIENYGRTPAFLKKVQWGICAEKDFPSSALVRTIIEGGTMPKGVVRTIDPAEDVFPPNYGPTIYPRARFAYPGPDNVFFGLIEYEDVFRERHHSTFKLRLVSSGSDPLEGCYTDWS